MSQIPRNRPGRPRNPRAPPAPEKPKRKVGRQSKKDQQAYNEALRINEANFRLEHPELMTAAASDNVPSLPGSYSSRNVSYKAKTKSTAAFPPNPFFRPVDIDEAESAFASEAVQSDEHPRCQAIGWQDLWKMSLHLFRAAPQKLLCGRLKPERLEEAEVYRELVFVLAHPCWERDLSMVTHALEQAMYTRSSHQAPPPFGPLGSQEWGLRLRDILPEIREEQQEPEGGPQLQASDVRAVRQGLDRLAHAFFENRTVDEYWKGLVCQTADIWHALIPADAATTARWDRGCAAGGGLERNPQPPVNHTPAPASNIASRLRKRRRTHISDDESDDDEDTSPPVAKRPRGRPKRPKKRTADPAPSDAPTPHLAEANAESAAPARRSDEEAPHHFQPVASGGEAQASQPTTYEDIGIGGSTSDSLDPALPPVVYAPPNDRRTSFQSGPMEGDFGVSQIASDRRQAPRPSRETTTTSGGCGASQLPFGWVYTSQTTSDGRAASQLPKYPNEASYLSREEPAASRSANNESAVSQPGHGSFTMSGPMGGGFQASRPSSEGRKFSQSSSGVSRLTRGGFYASHASNRGAGAFQLSHDEREPLPSTGRGPLQELCTDLSVEYGTEPSTILSQLRNVRPPAAPERIGSGVDGTSLGGH